MTPRTTGSGGQRAQWADTLRGGESVGGGTAAGWLAAAGALLAGGGALLPILSCPVCWPAYTALLSAVGIGFLNYTPYLGPLLVVLVSVSLAGLLPGAWRRRDLGPLLVGAIGASLLLGGRFLAANDWVISAGIGGLMAAAVWDMVAQRRSDEVCHT